jgi:hypothetical protein
MAGIGRVMPALLPAEFKAMLVEFGLLLSVKTTVFDEPSVRDPGADAGGG